MPTAAMLPPRLVLLHGLQTPAGEPVMAVATGSISRPHLRAFNNTADALAALREAGGGA
jgi:hypothetical protein